MSELKAVYATDKDSVTSLYYPKSEADKVIALLKDKANYNECAYKLKSEELADTCRFYEDELRHHKYKRCLGIAAVCFEKSYSTTLVKYDKESGYRLNFYDWWGKRWLALAEKFKPNN